VGRLGRRRLRGGGTTVAAQSSMGGHGGRVLWRSAKARKGEQEARASAGEAPSEPGVAPLRHQHAGTRCWAVGHSARAWPPHTRHMSPIRAFPQLRGARRSSQFGTPFWASSGRILAMGLKAKLKLMTNSTIMVKGSWPLGLCIIR
jgi:hypothetical protein